MVTMKGILCRIILKIHDPPPLLSLRPNASIRAAPLAGDALTALLPIWPTAVALLDIPKRNGSASGRQTPCRPVVYDHP